MIDVSITLANHFNISVKLCDEIINLIIASPEWDDYYDKIEWNAYVAGVGPELSEERQHDMIDWLADHFDRYLKLKIFV